MLSPYPLRFEPVFRRYLWGGRRLGEMLGKPIADGSDYAESWEIVDHAEEQSRVACGALAGKSLQELVREHSLELFGRHAPRERFPLLFKFLDCQRDLSVQVHPNDAQAARLDPPDLGKTEAWVILHADPGSVLYAGLNKGVTREDLEQAVAAGRTEDCLHRLAVQEGDCIFMPAGTVHALGAGLVVAEIQQASNTTYRLFDWHRLGADGQPRPLHVREALEVIDFDRGPVEPQIAQSVGEAGIERLVACDKFVLDRIRATSDFAVGGDDRFCLLSVLSGQISVPGDPAERPLRTGETLLLPAGVGRVELTVSPAACVLAMSLP